jgi:hypothetical protein
MNTSKIDVLARAAEEASARMNCKQFEKGPKRVSVTEWPLAAEKGDGASLNPALAVGDAQKALSTPIRISPTSLRIAQPPKSAVVSPNLKQKPTFVDKLHVVLADRECNSVISWLPSGKSFVVLDKEKFAKTVLPKYFKEAKFDR